MAQKQTDKGSGTTASEKARAKKKAHGAAQRQRKAGDYTPIQKLIDADLKKNESKYVIEFRKKKKKKAKPYKELLSGDK